LGFYVLYFAAIHNIQPPQQQQQPTGTAWRGVRKSRLPIHPVLHDPKVLYLV